MTRISKFNSVFQYGLIMGIFPRRCTYFLCLLREGQSVVLVFISQVSRTSHVRHGSHRGDLRPKFLYPNAIGRFPRVLSSLIVRTSVGCKVYTVGGSIWWFFGVVALGNCMVFVPACVNSELMTVPLSKRGGRYISF